MNKITTILSATVLLGSVAQAQFIVDEDFEGAGIPANFTQWVQGGGVTINTPETLLLAGEGASAVLIKVGTDEWDLEGNLEPA